MKYKQDYIVFDHQGQMIMKGNCKEISEKMQLNKKSIHNAIYNEKSLDGYLFFSQDDIKEYKSLISFMDFCRSKDRRYVDTIFTPKGDIPVYRDKKKDCCFTFLDAKDIDKWFNDDQILLAEKTYRRNKSKQNAQ